MVAESPRTGKLGAVFNFAFQSSSVAHTSMASMGDSGAAVDLAIVFRRFWFVLATKPLAADIGRASFVLAFLPAAMFDAHVASVGLILTSIHGAFGSILMEFTFATYDCVIHAAFKEAN
ncbi:hypothetical protein Ae201684P_010577 [Aphanomyces euteiches]|uniref:Uncharacterized protein n=1 Tax=Aphanomyces euteiches TaxID=100861 RepID=A0A6G0WP74_9STRA|nr:hypothetical protein Ae201684_013165 [Aphanomyces euteiches]KAH9076637.1 hypothetical protein Ae201684P_010577 [Aphanomyces euteiches]